MYTNVLGIIYIWYRASSTTLVPCNRVVYCCVCMAFCWSCAFTFVSWLLETLSGFVNGAQRNKSLIMKRSAINWIEKFPWNWPLLVTAFDEGRKFGMENVCQSISGAEKLTKRLATESCIQLKCFIGIFELLRGLTFAHCLNLIAGLNAFWNKILGS